MTGRAERDPRHSRAAGGDRGAARRAAVLSAVGGAERRLRFRHLPRLGVAARRRAAAERLHSDRRSQRRLHRAQHLRRLHRERVQRHLHRPRDRDRPADADASALLSRDVSVPAVLDEPGADRQQYRPDVGGDRAGDADDRADGRNLPHAGGDRGGVEIFHPRQRRHRARPVRHDPRLHGRPAGGRRRRSGHAVDEPDRPCAAVRSVAARSRLRLSAARLRHQGRPCAAARLAARTRTPKGRRRSPRCCPAFCSMSRSTPCCASSSCSTPTRARSRPDR